MVDLIRENFKTGYPEGVNSLFFFFFTYYICEPRPYLGVGDMEEKRKETAAFRAPSSTALAALSRLLCLINQVGAYRVQRVFCGSGCVRVGDERIF